LSYAAGQRLADPFLLPGLQTAVTNTLQLQLL